MYFLNYGNRDSRPPFPSPLKPAGVYDGEVKFDDLKPQLLNVIPGITPFRPFVRDIGGQQLFLYFYSYRCFDGRRRRGGLYRGRCLRSRRSRCRGTGKCICQCKISHYNPYPSRIQNDVLYWLVFQMNYETPTNLVQYKGHGNNSVFLVASGPALEKHRAEAYQEGTRRHQESHHNSPGGTGPFGTQGLSELESLYAA